MSAVLLALAVAATLGCLAWADRRIDRWQAARDAAREDAQGARTRPPDPTPGPEPTEDPQRPAQRHTRPRATLPPDWPQRFQDIAHQLRTERTTDQ